MVVQPNGTGHLLLKIKKDIVFPLLDIKLLGE